MEGLVKSLQCFRREDATRFTRDKRFDERFRDERDGGRFTGTIAVHVLHLHLHRKLSRSRIFLEGEGLGG